MASAASNFADTLEEEQEKSKSDGKANEASTSATPTPQHPPSTPRILKRASTTSLVPNISSTNSPKPSRETSPIRPPLRSGISANSSNPRSRKNSTDLSPNRGPGLPGPIVPAVPSAAAIQRALSVAGAHQLQPSTTLSDPATDPVRPQKSIKTALANNNQSASNLPRVRSPPPSTSNKATLTTSKRPDQVSAPSLPPSIVLDRPNRAQTSASDTNVSSTDTPAPSGMKIPSRGVSGSQSALETVQESSVPSTPALGPAAKQDGTVKTASDKRPERIEESSLEDDSATDQASRQESGNESGEDQNTSKEDEKHLTQQDTAKASAAKPHVVHPKKSSTQLHPAKGKTGAEAKSMTVETETVSSVPQVALGGGAGERGLPGLPGRTDTGGSLRLKPSTETIRPKKEKKRVVRKAPSLNAGTGRVASSKSDIFEAKVASAVDEANSSDSGETFVYESNPPEPLSARPHRYHSRTPSATSMASQIDHYGPRARQDGHHSVAGKKSMKFANNSYHSTNHPEAGETGTVRGPSSTRGTPLHHRHIGHFGRNGGHTSLFDNESPFPNATKPLRPQAGNAARLSPRPASPRDPQPVKVSGSPRKAREALSYDLEGEGADDEATPLMVSARSGRGRWKTKSGDIKDIRNVLASEQELMLDLHVHAVNPNLVAVQIGDLDINIFAKSKHVATNEMWRDRAYTRLVRSRAVATEAADLPLPQPKPLTMNGEGRAVHTANGVDEGTDPIPDYPGTDSQTMLLGRIFEFDSPLVFEASPWHHRSLSSLGEVRLAHPGNKTEEGGSLRWEKVIQYDFELIVRGVVKYSLPLSSTKRKASVGASVIVKPGLGIDSETGSMIVVRPGEVYGPGSNTVLRRPWRK
ncbi:MAG: hypothetical protein Q9168_007686 [Polycauliona sp. 1 TL-2023]